MCPESLDAVQGAIGAVCEAVDTVMKNSASSVLDNSPTMDGTQINEDPYVKKAFVAIRPPGHHCGEDSPSGFCFVNNVAVGAAHGTSS